MSAVQNKSEVVVIKDKLKPKTENNFVDQENSSFFMEGETYTENEHFQITETDFTMLERGRKPKIAFKIPLKDVFGVHHLKEFKEDFALDNYIGFLICAVVKGHVVKYAIHTKKDEDVKFLKILQELAFVHLTIEKDEKQKKTFKPSENFELLDRSRRRILFIINPVSGKKKGVSDFNQITVPILKYSHLKYDFIVTKSQGECTEICKSFDIKKYNEIGVVSGDGTIYECFNGLMNHKLYSSEQMLKIPISVLPCGGGNGLACSVGCKSVMDATLCCARGKYSKMDLFSCFYNKKRVYCFLSITHGLLADVDFGVEWLKNIGDVRFAMGGIYYLVKAKKYKIKMKYVNFENNKITDKSEFVKKLSIYGKSEQLIIEEKDTFAIEKTLSCDYLTTVFREEFSKVAPKWCLDMDKNKNKSKIDPKIVEVKEFKEDCLTLILSNLQHIAKDFYGSTNITPDSSWLDVMILHNRNKMGLIRRMGKLSNQMTGSHIKDKDMFCLRTKAMYLEPLSPGYVSIDGENMGKDYGPLLCEVHPSVARIMHF